MHHIRASRRRTHLEVRRPAPGGVHCALAPLQAGPLWIPPGAEPMLEQIVGWPSKADRKEEKIMNGEGRHVLSPSQAMIVRCTARAWKPKLRGTLAPGRAKCVQKTPPQKKGNMPLLKRIIPILIMLLFLPKFPGIAETNATATQEQLSHIENQIEAVDTTISQLDLRIEKCAALEYFRQLRWWELRKEVAAQERDLLSLQKQALQLELAGEPISAEIQRRITELQQVASSRDIPAADVSQVQAHWQEIQTGLDEVAPGYNWHVVKLNLLRDLLNRCRRIEFYLKEAMRTSEGGYGHASMDEPEIRRRLTTLMVQGDPEAFEIGPVYAAQENEYRLKSPFQSALDELVHRTRGRLTEYGECYFGLREQKLLGLADETGFLVQRTHRLAQDLEDLDARREELTADVLGFLGHFDKDGTFTSLGIPHRNEVSVEPDGNTSDLLFCTLSLSGTGGPSRDLEEPFCFDVADFRFYGVSRLAAGQPDPARFELAAADVKRGYYYKQPVLLMMHSTAHMTGVEKEFLPEQQRQDSDLHLTNANGDRSRYLNIWHPAVRELVRAKLTDIAAFCKSIPNFLLYDKLTWEPAALFVKGDSGPALEAGYSPPALAAFRVYLEQKFETVDRLNKRWKSSYATFDEIEPPPDPFVVPRRRATPLSHEFELFRAYSYGDYLAMATEAIRLEDPDHPVAAEIHTLNAQFVSGTAPAFQLMQRVPAQFIEDHYNNWFGSYTSLNMLYSLCLYAGKKPVQTEYIWTYPRLITPLTENDFRVTGELSIWRNMVWGRRVLGIWGPFDGWGYRFNYMDNAHSCELADTVGPSGTLIREAGTSIPLGKKRSREFWPYLDRTEVVKPRIAVIVPSTSMINDYPYLNPHEGYSTVNRELIRMERFLTPRDFDFRFVPEEVIVSGQENLAGFKAILLPYAPYFPDGLTDRLLAWVASGGHLIASGIPGIYDAYGFDAPALMDAVFGARLDYAYAGDDEVWRWKVTAIESEGVTQLLRSENGPLLFFAEHGAGRVLVSTESFFATANQRALQAGFAHAIETAIGWPTSSSRRHLFEMVTRQDDNGRRYLFVINPDLRDTAMDYITVNGQYQTITDMGIGSHCAIPLAPRQPISVNSRATDSTSRHSDGTALISVRSLPGRTTFQLRLEPGEGTVLELAQ